MIKSGIRKLVLRLTIAVVLSIAVMVALMYYNENISSETSSEIGELYLSEMMFQVQDHFRTIIDIKNKETTHLAEHAREEAEKYREFLHTHAKGMDFEYLAIYDQNGNYDTIVGEAAWFRDFPSFMERILSGGKAAATGYLTSGNGKYLVFGVPAHFPMESGETSVVMLAGFSVEKLYEYINLEDFRQLGGIAHVSIVLTNGSYILKNNNIIENSFFDHISNFGHFVGMSTKEGVDRIETAMAGAGNFSSTVSLNGDVQHIYGAPAGEPEDWYFMISMPQGAMDAAASSQHSAISKAFLAAGTVILLLLLAVFFFYLRLSMQQMREIEEARKEAEKARTEAENANKAKSVFLSNMSHDIRTPMNAIVGLTSIMEDSMASKDYVKVADSLVKMESSTNYLCGLINDVLDMSKIESGSMALYPEPMSIKGLVDTVETIIGSRAQLNNQNFKVNLHDILHNGVLCDHTRINQILINLLNNAVKFTPKGGSVSLEVWQEFSELGSDYIKTCFIIKDNGIGMSPEFINIMFESFTREDSKVRKIEGTGLGLTIVKSLVEMMDGTIRVDSIEGMGSSFFITLNLMKAEYIEKEPVSTEHIDVGGVRILMAEDNDLNYDIAETLLESSGFSVERAANGLLAVDMYCAAPDKWDIILMDLRMPILDGYQATEKIREFETSLPEERHIPIFAISADVFAEDIQRCSAVGMEGHIGKPIHMEELLKKLKRYITKE